MAHILPIRAIEAEEKRYVAQASVLRAEAEKLRAERQTDQQESTTPASGPKTEKIPRPTIDQGVSEGDWGFFTAQWERYVKSTHISGETETQQLWAACSTQLQKALHNGGAGAVTVAATLLNTIKSLAVCRRNNLVKII